MTSGIFINSLKSALNASSIKNAYRFFNAYSVIAFLSNGTGLSWLMTYYENTRTQDRLRTHIEKRLAGNTL